MATLNLEKVNASFSALSDVVDMADYDNLVALADALVGSGQAGPEGRFERLFLLVADLIEAHDKRDFRVPDAAPERVLRFLMDQHGLTQSQLPEVGNQSVVSMILAGRRQLNVRQIAGLCERFGVSADAFVPRPSGSLAA